MNDSTIPEDWLTSGADPVIDMSSKPNILAKVAVLVVGAYWKQMKLILVSLKSRKKVEVSCRICDRFADGISIVAIEVDEVRSMIEEFPTLLSKDGISSSVWDLRREIVEGKQPFKLPGNRAGTLFRQIRLRLPLAPQIVTVATVECSWVLAHRLTVRWSMSLTCGVFSCSLSWTSIAIRTHRESLITRSVTTGKSTTCLVSKSIKGYPEPSCSGCSAACSNCPIGALLSRRRSMGTETKQGMHEQKRNMDEQARLALKKPNETQYNTKNWEVYQIY